MGRGASMEISAFTSRLESSRLTVMDAAQQRVGQFARMVLDEAKALAPNDGKGPTLADTGFVGPVQISGDVVSVQLGFTAVYAAIQHERLDFHHQTGQAKYLEQPMRENAGRLTEFVAAGIRAEIG